MRKGQIFSLVMLVMVIILAIAFLSFAQFGYGQIPPAKPKIAVWKITRLIAEPQCYRKPEPGSPDFIYTIKAEFVASPSLLSPGDLVIEGKYESNYETTTKPPLNISSATKTWTPGTSGDILWNGDKIRVTKVSKWCFRITKSDCHISYKVDGVTPVKITLMAHTYVGTVKKFTDTKTLVINPCKK